MNALKGIAAGLLLSACLFSCEPCSALAAEEPSILTLIYNDIQSLREGQKEIFSLIPRVDQAEKDIDDLEAAEEENRPMVAYYNALLEQGIFNGEYNQMMIHYRTLKKKKKIGIASGQQ